MSYLIFARKFRPHRFQDVVGQEHITTTLQNAIKENRVAQSFLFSGTRGVGKTSTARILAKALNCEKGVVPEPCGDCLSCKEITQGISLDVLEIDGASNRGIDEIRNLRDNVKFKPAQGRFKVYVIDEVHMLTQEAFNALLKTLEEPPEHVKFIFATTELHKIPSTILSRCQRFTFRKVPTLKIVAKLKEIVEIEKLQGDEKALFAIAKAAEGSLRDAESLLDQVTSFSRGKINYFRVIDVLGTPKEETYLSLIDTILKKKTSKVLEIFSPMVFEGKDMIQFVRGLLEIFRALMILKVTEGDPEMIDFPPETVSQLQIQKNDFQKEDLLAIVQALQNLLRDVRHSPLPHLLVETALIKLAMREDLSTLSEILQKLNEMDRNSASQEMTEPRVSSATAAPKKKAFGVSESEPPLNSSSTHSQPIRTPTKTQSEVAPQSAQGSFDLNSVEQVWHRVLEQVQAKKMSCGTFLSVTEPVEVENDQIIIGMPSEYKFHKENLEKTENKKLVETAFHEFLGIPAKVSFVITVPEKISIAAGQEAAPSENIPEIVDSALKIFKGKIVQRL